MHKLLRIISKMSNGKKDFVAVCYCGWESMRMPSERAAELEFEDHAEGRK